MEYCESFILTRNEYVKAYSFISFLVAHCFETNIKTNIFKQFFRTPLL